MADPSFSSVSLLLLGDASPIVDSSSYAHSLTISGDAQFSSSSPKYGDGALLFDGSGDRVKATHASAFTLTGLFTVDWWQKTTDTAGTDWITTTDLSLGDANWWGVDFNRSVSGQMSFWRGAGSPGQTCNFTDTALNGGSWIHVAWTRDSSNVLRGYVAGVHKNSQTDVTQQFGNATGGIIVGGLPTFGHYNGRVDCFRLTKGVARWTGTGSFTPPTSLNDYLETDPVTGGPFPHYIFRRMRGGLYAPTGGL